jgi:2-succinyl-5-enolpyruvyl-6-hydroxy-3-cyclohexene-1-carboxylate synthase
VDYGRANLDFAGKLLATAAQHGLRHVVICPGSRSTPLALAAATYPSLQSYVLIDERSASYFALGMARQLGEPVALICTSGTAAANFAPAVIEAHLSRIPLLVLTADRPAELHDWGASQTIDQVELYGSHVRWSRDLPPPVGDPLEGRFARATAMRAMELADGPPAGPVHLNLQFREPLIPPDADPLERLREIYAASDPMTVGMSEEAPAAPSDTARLASLVNTHPRGLIVCGPHVSSELGEAVSAFSTATGYPCLADPLSTVRFSWQGAAGLIDAYDLFLRDAALAAGLAPELIVRLGGMPTSKPLTQFLARQEAPVVAIDPGQLRDPGHAATWHFAADEVAALQAVTSAVVSSENAKRRDWLQCWQELNTHTRSAIDTRLATMQSLNEPITAANLVELMPGESTLIVGNSMPVRDIDTFAAGGNRGVRVTGTRGASGIDGVTSAALGASAVANGPVALLTGDLSFLHDLGGLHAAVHARTPVVIVVINNDGGGIFSFLPQRTQVDSETFELLFGTPASVDIEGAARLFGLRYTRPATVEQFRCAVCQGLTESRVTVVEVRTDRAENLALHREIAAAVLAELADLHPA